MYLRKGVVGGSVGILHQQKLEALSFDYNEFTSEMCLNRRLQKHFESSTILWAKSAGSDKESMKESDIKGKKE